MKRNDNSTNSKMDMSAIDAMLESDAQQSIARAVRTLPEDVPSLAWRGSLNERLSEATHRSRSRRRVFWLMSPSFGLAAALCIAVLLPGRRHSEAKAPGPVAVASLEDQLLSSHSESVAAQDVVGSGLTSQEVQQSSDDDELEATPSS